MTSSPNARHFSNSLAWPMCIRSATQDTYVYSNAFFRFLLLKGRFPPWVSNVAACGKDIWTARLSRHLQFENVFKAPSKAIKFSTEVKSLRLERCHQNFCFLRHFVFLFFCLLLMHIRNLRRKWCWCKKSTACVLHKNLCGAFREVGPGGGYFSETCLPQNRWPSQKLHIVDRVRGACVGRYRPQVCDGWHNASTTLFFWTDFSWEILITQTLNNL